MKRQRATLIKIIFLLVVFFSCGINSYSSIGIQLYSIYLSSDNNNSDEDRLSSYNDSVSEDQITNSDEFGLTAGRACQRQNFEESSAVYSFCFSVWQPPKIC